MDAHDLPELPDLPEMPDIIPDIFCAQMMIIATFKHFENFKSGRGNP